MTNNIWGDYFKNPVELRQDGIFEVYEKYSPDVIGFQEVTKNWYCGKMFAEYLMQNYELAGSEAGGCKNYVPMAFRKDQGFVVLEKGYMLLPKTPDESKGITFVVLGASDDSVFAVCNTHFWWKEGEEHDKIREKNAEYLACHMKYIAKKHYCPVFAMGDMNCVRSSAVFDIYSKNGIVHLADISQKVSGAASCHGDPVFGEDGKYHGKKDNRPISESIDHIVVLGNVKCEEYTVIDDQCVLDSTDHSPIMATVSF